LTVIAIFAGLAEVSGSVVLPFLNADAQGRYIWFLMLFPVLLVVCFFVVLWNKHPVLYAPQDYRDEANFNAYISLASVAEIRANKIREVEPVEAAVSEPPIPDGPPLSTTASGQDSEAADRSRELESMLLDDPSVPPHVAAAFQMSINERNRRALLAEELALSKFQSESNRPIQRNMKLTGMHRPLVFDGAVVERDLLNVIDVQFIPANSVWRRRVSAFIEQMREAYLSLPDDLRKGFSATLLLVLDRGVALVQKPPEEEILKMLSVLPFPVLFKTYDFLALERSVGVREE